MTFRTNRHDRTRSLTYHPLGNIAQEHMHESRPTVGSHDDQINVMLLGITNDLHKWRTIGGIADYFPRTPATLFQKSRYAFKGTFA